jgi:hypothetical protein
MFGVTVTTIRTNPYPQPSSPAVAPDVGKMAAQRAFFAALTGKTEAAAQSAAAPTTAPSLTPTLRTAPADPPERILRPGSLIDIRV